MEWLDSVSLLNSHSVNFVVGYFKGDVFFYSLVIGRGGEQISRLQQESGCKIQIAPGKMIYTEVYCFHLTNGEKSVLIECFLFLL